MNIIFDLGGVLVDIDPQKTARAFARLSNSDPVDIMELHRSQNFFVDYEKGLIDDAAFRDGVRSFLGKDIPDFSIDQAWGAMLLDFPPSKIELLDRSRKKYGTFLLSNTNNIHRIKFEKRFREIARKGIHDYFENVHYSFEMHARKPDADIFERVLSENKLIPEQTLLIDDSLPNIQTADALGMKTLHVQINQPTIEIKF